MLDNLPKDDVSNNHALLKQLVTEHDPSVNTNHAAFNDVVLYYSAIFTTANQLRIEEEIDKLRAGRRLAFTGQTELDELAEEWGTTRFSGDYASGNLVIVVAAPRITAIPSGTVFAAGNKRFRTEAAYTARTSGPSMHGGDRPLVRTSEGWSFTLPVVALAGGSSHNVKKGTMFKLEGRAFDARKLYAAEDFNTGRDPEQDAAVVTNLTHGITAKLICGRHHIRALARFVLPGCTVSVVGFGDPELYFGTDASWPANPAKLIVYVSDRSADSVQKLKKTFIDARYASPAIEIEVKKALVCRVKVYIDVQANNRVFDVEDLRDVITAYVNGVGFKGYLSAAELTGVVTSRTGMVTIKDVRLSGEIAGDGQVVVLERSGLLSMPTVPEACISGRTVVFTQDSDDVFITTS